MATGELFIPVRNLKGAGEKWEPYNEHRTALVHKLLRADEHPRIVYRLKELVRLAAGSSASSGAVPHRFRSTGELVVAGVTNRIIMPIEMLPVPGGKLKVIGMTELNQSDYNIIPKPQRVVGRLGSDGDKVRITVEWIVVQKARP